MQLRLGSPSGARRGQREVPSLAPYAYADIISRFRRQKAQGSGGLISTSTNSGNASSAAAAAAVAAPEMVRKMMLPAE